MNNSVGGLALEFARKGRPAAEPPALSGALMATILSVSALIVFALTMRGGLVILANSPAFFALAVSMSLLALLRYNLRNTTTRAGRPIRDFSEYCLVFMIMSLLGVISTYPLGMMSSGFRDSALARVDELLHFDWVGWYSFVVRYPLLRQMGMVAYSTIYLSPAILLIYMAWHGQKAAARQFLMTFWLAALITLLLFPLFPAAGPLVAVWTGPIPYMPTTGLYQSEVIPELRAHLFTQIDLGALGGLVCAPSFHTVCGALYIAAAWPIAALRWPLFGLNAAMLLATPVEGNHYLSDMVLGLSVALVASLVMRHMTRLVAGGVFAGMGRKLAKGA